jgi:hypothetical protein
VNLRDAIAVLLGRAVAVERGHAYRINGALCVLGLTADWRWVGETPELIEVSRRAHAVGSESERTRAPEPSSELLELAPR